MRNREPKNYLPVGHVGDKGARHGPYPLALLGAGLFLIENRTLSFGAGLDFRHSLYYIPLGQLTTMQNKSSLIFVLFWVSLSLGAEHYFLNRISFGSQSCYHPVGVLLNGGYDILQIGTMPNLPFDIDYSASATNVIDNVAHPVRQLRRFGIKRFVGTEVFPTDFSIESSQYVPNYLLHVMGGGVTWRTLCEWYDLRGYPLPQAWATTTAATYHLLNELVENGSYRGVNVDPIADMLIFNPLGIVLFSFDPVARFAGTTLQARDWSSMPMFAPVGLRLENASQNYAFKWLLPTQSRVAAFGYFGMNSMMGATLVAQSGHSVSMATGWSTREVINVDDDLDNGDGRRMTIRMVWSAGMFLDRDNNLLGSLVVSGERGYRAVLNLFPGIIPTWGTFAPGVFLGIGKDYELCAGLTTRGVPLGLGARVPAN